LKEQLSRDDNGSSLAPRAKRNRSINVPTRLIQLQKELIHDNSALLKSMESLEHQQQQTAQLTQQTVVVTQRMAHHLESTVSHRLESTVSRHVPTYFDDDSHRERKHERRQQSQVQEKKKSTTVESIVPDFLML
jgi:hypothetical protein